MIFTITGSETPNEERWLATLVIYDHYESGCRAKAVLEQVSANTGGEIQFSLGLWRMDSLAYPGISTEVFGDLGRSTILVLALRTGAELPKSVFAWVECWAHCRACNDSALVILGNANMAALEGLQRIAEGRGITLFRKKTAPPGFAPQADTEGPEKREQFPTPIFEEEIPDRLDLGDYRDWGINE